MNYLQRVDKYFHALKKQNHVFTPLFTISQSLFRAHEKHNDHSLFPEENWVFFVFFFFAVLFCLCFFPAFIHKPMFNDIVNNTGNRLG